MLTPYKKQTTQNKKNRKIPSNLELIIISKQSKIKVIFYKEIMNEGQKNQRTIKSE